MLQNIFNMVFDLVLIRIFFGFIGLSDRCLGSRVPFSCGSFRLLSVWIIIVAAIIPAIIVIILGTSIDFNVRLLVSIDRVNIRLVLADP